MQDAGGELLRIKIRTGQTKHIRGRDGFGTESTAHDVANASADARGRATVRFDRRWVIMRFRLEGDPVLLVERDHTRVVRKHREAPVSVKGFGDMNDGVFQEILESRFNSTGFSEIVTPVDERALERLVYAMLRPGLRERLELQIGRVATEMGEVIAYGAHFLQR